MLNKIIKFALKKWDWIVTLMKLLSTHNQCGGEHPNDKTISNSYNNILDFLWHR